MVVDTASSENALIVKAKAGDIIARNEIIRTYLPVLRQRAKVYSRAPIPEAAIEGEAIRLLLHAVERYNPSKDVEFRTFLGHTLQGLYRYVNQNKNAARIPEHQVLEFTRFNNTKSIMRMDTGREPTREEMSDALGWSTAQVQRMESAVNRKELAMSGMEGLHEVERIDRKMEDVMEFEYFSMDPQEKLVYDYSLGRHGKPAIKDVKIMASRTGLTTDKIYEIKKKLSKRIMGQL
jgi:DNA-directed RNA polymerase sigma subunit (sigma70/sigma32)